MRSGKSIFIVSVSFLGIIFFACSRELQPPSKYTHPREYAFMDTIKSYSNARVDRFGIDLNTRDHLQPMERELVNLIRPYERSCFNLDDYSNYYFFDYQEFRRWVSFSILADTESGFMELYLFSYSKVSGDITSCTRINAYEADGGALRNNVLNYSSSGKELTVHSFYSFDEDIFSENEYNGCYYRYSDSTISQYRLSSGKTIFSTDTLFTKIDTICN